MDSKEPRPKIIRLDDDLATQLEALCKVLHTNFSAKTKELLVEWKIKELKRLREDAADIYQQYMDEINKKT